MSLGGPEKERSSPDKAFDDLVLKIEQIIENFNKGNHLALQRLASPPHRSKEMPTFGNDLRMRLKDREKIMSNEDDTNIVIEFLKYGFCLLVGVALACGGVCLIVLTVHLVVDECVAMIRALTTI